MLDRQRRTARDAKKKPKNTTYGVIIIWERNQKDAFRSNLLWDSQLQRAICDVSHTSYHTHRKIVSQTKLGYEERSMLTLL